jgi:hypothetical protein
MDAGDEKLTKNRTRNRSVSGKVHGSGENTLLGASQTIRQTQMKIAADYLHIAQPVPALMKPRPAQTVTTAAFAGHRKSSNHCRFCLW